MAYSIVSGRYYYEENGDYFEFDALLDEYDHSKAGSFAVDDIIYDESTYGASPGFFVLSDITNYAGDPYQNNHRDSDFLDVKSYYDSDSGIQLDEISGTGYDNGYSSLRTTIGMEGEVEIEGLFIGFDTSNEIDFADYMTGNDGVEDLDGDGFVDEVTNYQMWTASGGVDLTNRRGRTYSDSSSRKWDAIKAVEIDTGFSILVEGQQNIDGKFKVVSANEQGVIGGATRWLNGNQMLDSGYEEIFSMDFNGNGVVDFA